MMQLSLGRHMRQEAALRAVLELADAYIGELTGRPGAEVSIRTRYLFLTPGEWQRRVEWLAETHGLL